MSEQTGPTDSGDQHGWGQPPQQPQPWQSPQSSPSPQQGGWQQPHGEAPQGMTPGQAQAPGQKPYQGPASTTSEERNWALGAHVGSFVAAFFALAFLAPLGVMLLKGKESQFIRMHAVESLNFQISAYIYFAVSFLLAFVLIGFLLIPVVAIFYLVVVIIATIKASNGEPYRYPLTIRLVS